MRGFKSMQKCKLNYWLEQATMEKTQLKKHNRRNPTLIGLKQAPTRLCIAITTPTVINIMRNQFKDL